VPFFTGAILALLCAIVKLTVARDDLTKTTCKANVKCKDREEENEKIDRKQRHNQKLTRQRKINTKKT
jgi:hypothetical protein